MLYLQFDIGTCSNENYVCCIAEDSDERVRNPCRNDTDCVRPQVDNMCCESTTGFTEINSGTGRQ